MTQAQALEVKEILMQIRDSIPATHVDRIFYYYQTYIDPTTKHKPCTCTGKYWTGYLFSLKDKVTDTLRETEESIPEVRES